VGPAGNITFRAWDTTDGNLTGATGVDVSSNGGTTAFSSLTETATLSVVVVNDAPTLDNSGTPTLTGIDEDDTGNEGDLISAIVAA